MAKKPWADNWETKNQLGGGGQGNTFLVTQIGALNETYVLKVLKNQTNEERRMRMYREVEALRKLNHYGIPKVIDTNANLYADKNIEHITGPTLEEHLKTGILSPQDALQLTIQLVEIIRYCHDQGIIHRDIKPDNIILRNDNVETPVLIDFGQSYDNNDSSDAPVTAPSEHLGNRFIFLPELQTRDSSKRFIESDITQLCGILFYSLTHQWPEHLSDHEKKKPHERIAAKTILSQLQLPSLLNLFDRGFESELRKRYRSFDAFHGRVKEVLDDYQDRIEQAKHKEGDDSTIEQLPDIFPPFDDATASKLASKAIGSTRMIAVKAFRNAGSKRNYIAAISERIDLIETATGEIGEKVNERKVYILEQIGKAFRPIWESSELHSPKNLQISDLDADGIHEVSYTEEAHGAIGGSKEMHIYFMANQTLYKIEEFYHWGSLGGPECSVEMTGGVSNDLQLKIENFAESQGFLTGEIPYIS
jgi:serine/threonine protein kinase